MKAKLDKTSIVVLATAHNPSIISPQWLKDKGLVGEEPTNFFNSPDVSTFETDKIIIIVDSQRLNVTARKFEPEILKYLPDLVTNYVKLLPNIPYTSFGINFQWLFEQQAGNQSPIIKISSNTISDFSQILPDHNLSFGGIVFAKKDPYSLKLTIEPKDGNQYSINFNFHHEIKGASVDKIIEYLQRYEFLHQKSLEITEKL